MPASPAPDQDESGVEATAISHGMRRTAQRV